MAKILIPRSDSISVKTIEPSDFESYFSNDYMNDYIVSGFTLTAGTGLAVNISSGTARVKGLFANNTTSSSKGSLTASNTNYIYVTLARDTNSEAESWSFTSNITGTTPTDSLFIGTATTNGSGVTAVAVPTDHRYPLVNSWLFGNGQDGDATLSGNTTLNEDKYYNDLTINSGVNVTTSSRKKIVLFCKGTLTLNGTISVNGRGGTGGSSSGAVGGTGGNSGQFDGCGSNPTSGTAGANGSSPNGEASVGIGAAGGSGGAGGTGGFGGAHSYSSGGGRSGGSGSIGSGVVGTLDKSIYHILRVASITDIYGGGGGCGGTGGGGGGGINGRGTGSCQGDYAGDGGDGLASNANGGAGAGMILIFAKNIVIGSTGSLTANGSNGSNASGTPQNGENASTNSNNGYGASGGGGGGGSGGGGGGCGGFIGLFYNSKTQHASATITVSGGTGGSGVNGADGGTGYKHSVGLQPAWDGQDGNNGATGATGGAGVIVNMAV